MAKAEGKSFDFQGEEAIKTSFLESFPFNGPSEYIVTASKEFSAVCPFSGLPDVADVIIEYLPLGGLCVELKSLKYYMISFRNVGLYQEGVTKRMYDDLKALLNTNYLRVTTRYYPRGGFYTLASIGKMPMGYEIPFHMVESK